MRPRGLIRSSSRRLLGEEGVEKGGRVGRRRGRKRRCCRRRRRAGATSGESWSRRFFFFVVLFRIEPTSWGRPLAGVKGRWRVQGQPSSRVGGVVGRGVVCRGVVCQDTRFWADATATVGWDSSRTIECLPPELLGTDEVKMSVWRAVQCVGRAWLAQQEWRSIRPAFSEVESRKSVAVIACLGPPCLPPGLTPGGTSNSRQPEAGACVPHDWPMAAVAAGLGSRHAAGLLGGAWSDAAAHSRDASSCFASSFVVKKDELITNNNPYTVLAFLDLGPLT
ncbi:hypothetical protein B0T26DRAFT_138758 [Lasiosphaeria miniovina]|uniref:Uncharacterized protein n=1 Tax=Lasiosphaeria miniovina TaxID=1954250 RepID=A0AA40E849_9PEZI|nr:uncharacterized protein B0T26DRAFT_138758 [Lasiosphaeria miniovina]KAK0727521.1 hypothetical protein B0T26DRAFT_138758 [Lasiosphaeria miniovina]